MKITDLKIFMNKKYVGIYILFLACLFPIFLNTEYKLHFVFANILFVSILIFLFAKKQKYLFEPIYIFSLYYLTVPIVIWYYIFTDFKNNKFIAATTFDNDFSTLFLISVLFFVAGYLLCLLGYHRFKKREIICKIELESKNKISDLACYVIGIGAMLLGLLNFGFNVMKYSNGNVFAYLFSMAHRTYEFAQGGTTIGYTIASAGIFVLLFKAFRDKKHNTTILFLVSFFLVFIMKLSTGRIFSTISFVGIVIAVYYWFHISETGKTNNRMFLIAGCILLVLGVVVFFIRIVGGLNAVGMLNASISDYFSKFVDQFGYYAIDSGNMPNIALMPKIIDSWGQDIGYLHGASLFSFLFTFIPTGLSAMIPMPGILIKEAWFMSVPSGNLPVTIVGEFFVNFGWLGPIIGMLLFGVVITIFFNYTVKKRNFWLYVVMVQVAIGFIALSPKGEFNNLSLWMILPYAAIYFGLIILTKIQYKIRPIDNKKKTENSE